MSRGIFSGNLFPTKFLPFQILFSFEEIVSEISRKTSAGLSKLHFKCPQEISEGTSFWKWIQASNCFRTSRKTCWLLWKSFRPVFETTFYVSSGAVRVENRILGTISLDSFCCMILSESFWVSRRKTRQFR